MSFYWIGADSIKSIGSSIDAENSKVVLRFGNRLEVTDLATENLPQRWKGRADTGLQQMRQLEDQAIQGGYASQLLKVELAVNRASGSQVLKQVNSQLLFAAVREDPSLLQKSTVLGLLSSAFTRNRGSMGESGVVDPLIGAVKARPELLVQATVLSLLRSVFAEGLLRDSDTLFLDLFKAIENAPKLVYAEHFLDLLQHAIRGCRGANSPSVVFKLLSEAVKKDPKLFGQSRVFETLADAAKEASKTRSPSAAFEV